MLLMNPRRRRKKGARRAASRRRARKMTAKQLMYFGKGRRRSRRSARRSARRSPAVQVFASNPVRRRRRRSMASARRRYRRNPISLRGIGSAVQLRASLGTVAKIAKNAAVGGAGAVLADVMMGNLLKVLPAGTIAAIGSRYSTDGNPNLAYYGTKLGLFTVGGILATNFLPARFKGFAAQAVEGAVTVGAYEMLRLMMPANVALGYYTSAQVLPGAGVNPQRRNLGAYVSSRRLAGLASSGSSAAADRFASIRPSKETRVGEGGVQ